MHGRRVRASTPEASWQGTAEGITHAGQLILRQDNGETVALTSAEVRFIHDPT